MYLYRILSKLWRNTYIKWKKDYTKKKQDKYWDEQKRSYGRENPDKTFFVIRRKEMYVGLFSYYITAVYYVARALEQGYIPVIDLQNSPNMYLKKEEVGKVNVWDLYFKQPCGYTMHDVKKSRNVILSSGDVGETYPYLDTDYLLDPHGEIRKWRKAAREYFHLSDRAEKLVTGVMESFQGKRVLGVLCRGTDYVANKPRNHPIQPTLEQLFEKVDDTMKAYHCSEIFLGTEDLSFYQAFRSKYGEHVITNRKHFVDYHGEDSFGKLVTDNVQDVKEEGMEYLVTIAVLSRCHCFVGGHTSGTIGVILMNEDFEYSYIFNLGKYGK